MTLANRVSLEIGRRTHISLLSSRSVQCHVFCHLIVSLVANRPQFMFCVFWKSRPLRLWRHCTIVLYIYCKEVSVVDMISYNNVALIFQTWDQRVHLFALCDVYHWLMCTPVRFYYFNNTWTTLIVSNDSISIGKNGAILNWKFPNFGVALHAACSAINRCVETNYKSFALARIFDQFLFVNVPKKVNLISFCQRCFVVVNVWLFYLASLSLIFSRKSHVLFQ